MPREPRVVVTGVPHHITQRGNARQDVFTADWLRRAYLELLAEHARASRLRVLAYCLLTNRRPIRAGRSAPSGSSRNWKKSWEGGWRPGLVEGQDTRTVNLPYGRASDSGGAGRSRPSPVSPTIMTGLLFSDQRGQGSECSRRRLKVSGITGEAC